MTTAGEASVSSVSSSDLEAVETVDQGDVPIEIEHR